MATTITRRLDVDWGATGVTQEGSGLYYYDAAVSSDKDLRVLWDNGGTGVGDKLRQWYPAEDVLHNGAAITPVNQVTVGTINSGNLSQTNLPIVTGNAY